MISNNFINARLPILFLILPGLFSAPGISKAYDPKMLSGFIKRGKEFENVVEIKIAFENGVGRCSGVRARTPQKRVVILTAAHCLEHTAQNGRVLSPTMISIGDVSVSYFFEHPLFRSAPQYDIAVLMLSEENSLGGLELYEGSPEDLLHETLTHVGYGKIVGRKATPRQAFQVFPSRITSAIIEQSPYQEAAIIGEAVDGDSGGPLIVSSTERGNEMAGVFSWYGGATTSQNFNQWTLVTSDFIKLLDTAFSDENRNTKALTNLTLSARDLWLRNEGKSESWNQIDTQLRMSPENQYYLGLVAELDGNIAAASEWLEKSANQNHGRSACKLGMLMLSTSQDTKAVKWFTQAAQQAIPDAHFQLSGMYALGKGVKKNLPKAVKHYQEALKQGPNLLDIQNNLIIASTEFAEFYYARDGGLEDDIRSAKYFEIAAQLGDDIAQQNMRTICFALWKKLSKRDPNAALRWLRKAAHYGSEEAVRVLNQVHSEL